MPRRWAAIDNIVVQADQRGRGIGRLLMAAAQDWAKARGLYEVELTVFEFNDAARHLYENLGYRTLTRRMRLKLDYD
jgi:ribosomal protein S18 acetylase RimI-like enzyme